MNANVYENINGDQTLITVERAINELRCGRALYCHDLNAADPSQRGALLASAETTSAALLSRLQRLAGGAGMRLAITGQRAETLGLRKLDSQAGDGTVLLQLHPPASPATVGALAGTHASRFNAGRREFSVAAGDAISTAALHLAKQARLLPAVLLIATPPPPADEGIVEVSVDQLDRLTHPEGTDLELVSEARVPLASHEDCRLVLFRDGRDASEHIAVVVGSPDVAAAPVPVRLHSACLTGDLLGSLRCDCGDQLRSAVDQLAAAGGGVLLYLAQEGRGIGLANKLRAYELQDTGLDTLEADRHLGFRADERSYVAAASMLRHLGMSRIHLLTNNLEKIAALQQAGIEVVTGQRLLGAVNRHNVRYIRAKRERSGHLMPEINVEEIR